MSDAVENYQNVMQKYQSAYTRARQLVTKARQCAAALEDWRNIMISNTGSSYPGTIRSDSPILNANDWPSINDIDAALVEYHKAKENMEIAYDAIPSSVRSVIKSPANHIAEIEKDIGTRYSR